MSRTAPNRTTPRGPDGPGRYRIVVAGRLGPEWSLYFDGLAVQGGQRPDGTVVTTLSGILADQAALYGILARIQNVGLPLLEVAREDEG